MSNSKMLEKKKWVVKMVILDSKDAKVSDINGIKCVHDDSTKNAASNDTEKRNIVTEERKEPRARTTRSKPENVPNQRNLRSSKQNAAAISSSFSDINKCKSSTQDMCDEEPIEKKEGKMLKRSQKSATINMASSEKEKILVSDFSSSDTGALAGRSSKTSQECGPSMPVLFNACEISPGKSSWKLEVEKIPAKIKKRRFTTGNFTSRNSSRLDPSLIQENTNVSKSKVARQETIKIGKTNTPLSDQEDSYRELLESLAQGRKYFYEKFSRNKD